jgi:hypothetical protein
MATTVEELMKSAVDARRVAQNALRIAVREARAADWSWDRISAALGGTPNGETLRATSATANKPLHSRRVGSARQAGDPYIPSGGIWKGLSWNRESGLSPLGGEILEQTRAYISVYP